MVPITGNDVDGTTATIEYAVEVLKVKHAILCGHSDCGAMKAALDREGLENLPKASRWLHHVEAAFSHRQPLNPADGEHAELAPLIRGNVVAQLLNLNAQPSVARALVQGAMTVHGVVLRHSHRADRTLRRADAALPAPGRMNAGYLLASRAAFTYFCVSRI